jgi:hypothetical protein
MHKLSNTQISSSQIMSILAHLHVHHGLRRGSRHDPHPGIVIRAQLVRSLDHDLGLSETPRARKQMNKSTATSPKVKNRLGFR